MSTVPDFNGLSVSGVNQAAAAAGVNVEFYGSDLTLAGITAYKQTVPAGTEVESGAVVGVYFRTNETAE